MTGENLYRQLPKTDGLLATSAVAELLKKYPYNTVHKAVQDVLEELRLGIKNGEITTLDTENICASVAKKLVDESKISLRRVINGTGVILHTNLGRALLADEAVEAVCDVATHFNTLEYNPETGGRGSRYSHMESLICKICSCEAAMVVNNNAAAVMLILGAITKGREVPVSRGELVEIGGSFRVPEIMEQSGTILKEIGSTNKTHLSDYKTAINENTGAILKVHTSNFKIVGFSEEVGLGDLAVLAHEHDIPLIYDLGGGALCDLEKFGISDEPNVFDCVKAGADIISFSGDKLFGGPQAGIIIGGREYIEKMKKHPLTRAFRCDKMTIAALCATLALYTDEESVLKKIPTLAMLSMTNAEIDKKAKKMYKLLENIENATIQIVPESAQVGGGSVPSQMLATKCIALRPRDISVHDFETQLRHLDVPIIARLSKDRVLFDMRTIATDEIAYVVAEIKNILGETV